MRRQRRGQVQHCWPTGTLLAAAPSPRPGGALQMTLRWITDDAAVDNVWNNVRRSFGALQQNEKPPLNWSEAAFRIGVADGTRTPDSRNHNRAFTINWVAGTSHGTSSGEPPPADLAIRAPLL